MTNPALDAFERFIEYGIDSDRDIVRTALSNAPEVVTVEEYAERMRGLVVLDGQYSYCYGRDTAKVFPNGLKITAAPNGGA